jgi:small nuclear ribonucleoprotein (snRNP)-like protein
MPYLVTGTLKGYDQLMNLVLDDVKEITRGTPNPPPLHTSDSLLAPSISYSPYPHLILISLTFAKPPD